MKKRNKILISLTISVLFVLSLVGVGGILAGLNNEAINNVDTGVVNIRIDEFMLDEQGNEVPWQDSAEIVPGRTVSKIPYFTATGNDCYIRATIDVEEALETGNPITYDSLRGMSDKWVKAGDYFYYTESLTENERVQFFTGVEIPNWGDEVNPRNVGDWDIDLIVSVDAIQSENFTPDFNSESPWGDVEIKESIHKDGYDMSTFTQNSETSMSVVFEDEDNIVVKPKDFFEGFKTMVPGDTLTDTVTFDIKKKSKIYFSTEPLTDLDMLNKMKLNIVLHKDGKDEIIYNGALSGEINDKVLGEFEVGEKSSLSFTVFMPEELDNQYTLRNASVKWIFAMEPINDVLHTGIDSTMALVLGLIVLGLIVLIVIVAVKRRKGNKAEDSKNEKEVVE